MRKVIFWQVIATALFFAGKIIGYFIGQIFDLSGWELPAVVKSWLPLVFFLLLFVSPIGWSMGREFVGEWFTLVSFAVMIPILANIYRYAVEGLDKRVTFILALCSLVSVLFAAKGYAKVAYFPKWGLILTVFVQFLVVFGFTLLRVVLWL